MARTMIAMNSISLNAGTALTSTSLTAGGTGTAGFALQGVKDDSKVRLVVGNAGATGLFTVKAPSSGGYCLSSVGDLTVVLGGGGIQTAVEIDGARYRLAVTGTIDIDCGAATGVLLAFQ